MKATLIILLSIVILLTGISIGIKFQNFKDDHIYDLGFRHGKFESEKLKLDISDMEYERNVYESQIRIFKYKLKLYEENSDTIICVDNEEDLVEENTILSIFGGY